MGLRDTAEADLAFIMEDDTHGFGYPIILIAPDGTEYPDLVGFSNDIAEMIDPDTGVAVSGRQASIALRQSTMIARGISPIPNAAKDYTKLPWRVRFDSINGVTETFKMVETFPDNALGVVTYLLEGWKE